MLQTVEAIIDLNGNIRLFEFLRANRLPETAKPSVEEIDAQIEEARSSWE